MIEWVGFGTLWWLAFAGALLWLGLSLRTSASSRFRLAELLCLLGAAVGLMLALAQPTMVKENERVVPGRVAVLVDASRSMSVDEGGETRFEQASHLVDDLGLANMDRYSFADDLIMGPGRAPDGGRTDVGRALVSLREKMAGEKLAGVVLLTDGIDQGSLSQRVLDEEALALELPGPLTVYQMGTAMEDQDLAVESLMTGGFAFVRTPFVVRSRLRGPAGLKTSLPVSLLLDDTPLSSKTVTLDEQGFADVEFEVIPERAGRFAFTVSLPVLEGDPLPANNTLSRVVRVVRDRIRVLQVAGAPSWDVKFLRRFLKGDPSVDLVSFFILRTPADVHAGYHERELSLIEFPYQRLFSDDLWSFDVVIFQNFDYRPYFRTQSSVLLTNVRDYVAQGGAFVMVGGDNSFQGGDYHASPLDDVLPLAMASPEPLVAAESFSSDLTQAGKRHPITKLSLDPDENEAWWNKLTPLDGANIVGPARPNTAVLLTHPTTKLPSGEPVPIVAVREFGKGRSMALAADSSWRWSFSEAKEGRSNQAYLKFWKNSLLWLVADPTIQRVLVTPARENVLLGDEVELTASVRDEGYEALAGARVLLERTAGGQSEQVEGLTDEAGEARFVLPSGEVGTHRVAVRAFIGDREVGAADSVFAVTARDPEMDELRPDGVFLKGLASKLGGRFYGPGDKGAVLLDQTVQRVERERSEQPLWNHPLLLAWITLLTGLSWLLRRMGGGR